MPKHRTMSTQSFKDETYKCGECKKNLEETEIKNWRCTYCDKQVLIDSDSLKHKIMRKFPEEVTSQDTIMLSSGSFHEVLSIKKIKDAYHFNLKNHGNYKIHTHNWVNCLFPGDD